MSQLEYSSVCAFMLFSFLLCYAPLLLAISFQSHSIITYALNHVACLFNSDLICLNNLMSYVILQTLYQPGLEEIFILLNQSKLVDLKSSRGELGKDNFLGPGRFSSFLSLSQIGLFLSFLSCSFSQWAFYLSKALAFSSLALLGLLALKMQNLLLAVYLFVKICRNQKVKLMGNCK